MPRLVMITPSFYPRVGGVEKHVLEVGSRLKRQGWEITVLTPRFPGLAKHEVVDGLIVKRFSFPAKRWLGLLTIWWQLWRQRRLIGQADLVQIHDVFIWYLPLRLWFWSLPVVTTWHGWEGIFPVPKKNIWYRQLGNWLSTRSIAVGHYLTKYYRVKANEIIYGAVTSPTKLPKKKSLLLYVGRLDYDTGLPVLLQALSQKAWNGPVIFCGDGLLREQAELFGKVKGFVDPRPYLKQARVVFAGGYLSVLEALAYRCMVVAAENNTLKKDYYRLAPFARWVNLVSQPTELARQLKSFNRSSKKINRRLDEGQQWASKQTWQWLTNKYLKLYSTILYK